MKAIRSEDLKQLDEGEKISAAGCSQNLAFTSNPIEINGKKFVRENPDSGKIGEQFRRIK